MNKTDYKDMWVFIERDGDSVLPVSLELCSETRRLCDASGEKLVAVIVGSISDGELQRVLDCGVDKVIHVTGTGYDYFNNDAYTNLFTVLCRKYRPTAVMVGGTINGRDFAPRFAARLGTGCTSDATELVWDPKTTDIEFVEPAVGGKMMAVITVPVARPQVGTIRPGTFKCVPCGARAHEVIEEHIDFPVADIRTEILDFRADDLDESLNIADADVIVCVGYLYGASLAWAADQYPDVKFIAVDVTQGDIGTDEIPSNCYCITFKEEQAGYLAGYAIAKDGKTKLGFLGGMAVPAVIRYGYGFVQGADAAAQELGQNIDINYFYGGQFYGDANITSRMEGWYSNGTQVVFACGGGIYTSAVEAALKNNGYVIGVDVDQNYIGANGVADGTYAYNPFITSAMKGLSEAVNTALSDIEAGDWSEIAASNGNFGLEDGDYVGLPTDADSWNFETFTTDEYEALKEKIKSGEITVDNSSDDSTKPTVSEFTTVNYIQ